MSPRSLLFATAVLLAGRDARAFTGPAAPSAPPRPPASATALAASAAPLSGRRALLRRCAALATLASFAALPAPARALDFDAFERGEIATDTARCDPKRDPKCIPKITGDEALCQYGSSGDARGEACARVKRKGGTLPEATKAKGPGGAYAL